MRVVRGMNRCVAGAAAIVAAIASATPLAAQEIELTFSFVPATDLQPGGPAYDFRVSRFEVHNDLFVEFLKDALANLDNERGFYLYFDTDSGDVYINGSQQGTIGVIGSGTLVFSASVNPYVSYDDTIERYEVTPGFDDHPVTGVTWYGAVKFCNWLTIATGLGVDDRAYTEADRMNLNGWHPVTISYEAWSARDLSDAERDALLEKLGYRLLMDGGGDPGPYNEWYKAAAWDANADGGAGANHVYGFGRDTIDDADANFRCSHDPFEDEFECILGGTTPVGYYDGRLDGGFQTRQDDNAYGLFDMSGNVWEWVQDQGFDQPDRRNRGGSFQSGTGSLEVMLGAERSADSANDSTGFRVVQSVVTALLVTPDTELVVQGLWGGPYDPDPPEITYRVANITDDDVDYSVSAGADWVTIDGGSSISGTLGGEEFVEVLVGVALVCADPLAPGMHTETVTFLNEGDGTRIERTVQLTITEPLTLTPAGPFSAAILFGDTPPTKTYTLANGSAWAVEWSVRATNASDPEEQVDWVEFNDVPGMIDGWIGRDPMTVDVTIGFDTTGLDAGLHSAVATFVDECTGTAFPRNVVLTIDAPFQVTPGGDVVSTGVAGGPFAPSSHTFTIESLIVDPITWSLAVEAVPPETVTDWLLVDPLEGTLPGSGEGVEVFATIDPAAANTKEIGQYVIRLTFEQSSTGFTVEREVTLDVTDLILQPTTGVAFAGPRGGPFLPPGASYTLYNTGLEEMPWTAEASQTWIDVSPAQGTILNPEGTAEITVAPSPDAATLAPDSYTGIVTVTSTATDSTTIRTVELVVGEEAFGLEMVQVPPSHLQPSGPTHRFRISKYEVTNDKFVQFLNDAEADGGATERSSYMNFDAQSGSVALPSGEPMLITQNEIPTSRIVYCPALAAGTRYTVEPGFEQHPVTHVSWYGAVKFCNWLTIAQGMTSDQRAYTEGQQAADWGPVAVADQLIHKRGFRLPIDDEQDEASPYNEWYKAAAWQEDLQVNALYGFGRDQLAGDDANYGGSGDPFEPGTTPVGFFDGTIYNPDGGPDEDQVPEEGDFTSESDDNAYALFDMSGNVAEWVQDVGNGAGKRGVRGGHFESVETSPYLKTTVRGSQPADAALAFIGFRVVQALPDTLGDITVTHDLTRADGFIGGPYRFAGGVEQQDTFTVTIFNPNDYTVDDLSLSITPPNDRLKIVGVAPQQVPAASAVDVQLEIAATVDAPGVSPPPPSGDFVLLPGSDGQPNGPEYDFWISRTEVTNTQFAALLNSALDDLRSETPSERSHYMYYDIDSGSVYINDEQVGEEGIEAPSETLMYDASVGRIHLVGDTYNVESSFEDHPVVGVTWYGAVKYCNWFTLSQGVPGSLRAYTEDRSSNLIGWHPVVVDDATWATGGMSGVARQLLIEDTLGYRLPMDNEAAGASPYNEWYKAAAWNSVTQQENGYGFGRDVLTDADANYFESCETEQDGTTPVRFFNGVNTLLTEPPTCTVPQADPISTVDTENDYGLYDASGNVSEWTQDFGTDISNRSTRGGSWRDPFDSPALTTTGRTPLAPETAADDVGFRVVRGTGHVVTVTIEDRLADATHFGYFILDLREPFRLDPRTDFQHSGMYRDLFAGLGRDYDLANQSDSDMAWEVCVDQSWVDVAEEDSGEQDGTITGGANITITVEANTEADTLGPGEHDATVTFRNVTTSESETRKVILSIDQPITVTSADPEPHEFFGFWSGPFDSPLPARLYDLTSRVTFDLQYNVTVDEPWLTVEPVNPTDQLSGTLPAGGTIPFTVNVNDNADTLSVGGYDAAVRFTFTDQGNNDLTDAIEQPISLSVNDPITIDQSDEPWGIGPNLDPEDLPSQIYTLTNNVDVPIEVIIDVDHNWVNISDAQVEVLPGEEPLKTVTASVNDNALLLFDGEYVAIVTFDNITTGFQQCRTIILTIEETLSVAPFDDYVASGIPSGSIGPPMKIYRLTNVARDQAGDIEWEASVQTPGVDWIRINGGLQTGGYLADGQSTNVIVSIDSAQTSGLAEGSHIAVVEFHDVTNNESMTRTVELSLVIPTFNVEESSISTVANQPAGPSYPYTMGTHHTTNVEFVAFLNDAMANLGNERGQYMFFDTETGDVYVNTDVPGETGNDPTAREVKMFSPTAAQQIELVAGQYEVITAPTDYSNHPVTGVSWYGALKFCNWMTLDQGMLPSERCYRESTESDLTGWRPITISQGDWETRDLDDAERADLVAGHRGYRLPMDDGCNNADPTTDSADAYNEWYKAAAWDASAGGGAGANHVYGFGRDTIDDADANFRCSHDPFEDEFDCILGGTTSVGYYDGRLDGGFQTRQDDNAYGLFDTSGNVWEWVQGRFNSDPDSIDFRTIRGGSWNEPATSLSLRTDSRSYTDPSWTNSRIGLRVLRALQETLPDVDQDGDVDQEDFAGVTVCLTGPYADLVQGCAVYDLDGDVDVDLADMAMFQNAFTGSTE